MKRIRKGLTTEQFINKAKKIYGDKYDYSLVKYENNKSKIKIICPEHGEFEQEPRNHLSGHKCKKCGFNHTSKEDFLKIINLLNKEDFKIQDLKIFEYNGEIE